VREAVFACSVNNLLNVSGPRSARSIVGRDVDESLDDLAAVNGMNGNDFLEVMPSGHTLISVKSFFVSRGKGP
jgi:hypothetical protein